MARQQKTTQTDASVRDFIATVADDAQRADTEALTELMREATGAEPAMWGSAIIGYGACVNDKGATWMRLGFSPRKGKTAVYLLSKPDDYEARLATLGTHQHGASCLYLKRLADVDLDVLRELVAATWAQSRATMPDPAA